MNTQLSKYSEVNTGNIASVPAVKQQELLYKIWSILEAQSGDATFDAAVLANLLGLSRSSLHRKVMHLSGTSPGQLILTYRLKVAERLLAETDLSVKEISWKVGYAYESGFARVFKKVYGCSALNFRKKYGKYIKSETDFNWRLIYEKQSWEIWLNTVRENTWLLQVVKEALNKIRSGELNAVVLANELNMSIVKLNKRCLDLLGINTRRLLIIVRLFYACYLMKERQCSIAQASFDAGFYDQAHFRKVYRMMLKKGEVPKDVLEQLARWIADKNAP